MFQFENTDSEFKSFKGFIMTGTGDDGVSGLCEMPTSGSYTLAPNEESCDVFGMPKEAIKSGAVDEITSLEDIPRRLLKFASKNCPGEKYNIDIDIDMDNNINV